MKRADIMDMGREEDFQVIDMSINSFHSIWDTRSG